MKTPFKKEQKEMSCPPNREVVFKDKHFDELVMSSQPLVQAASPYSLRNSVKNKTIQSYTISTVCERVISLCLNQVANHHYWEYLLSSPVIPYSVPGLSLLSECPSSVFNYVKSSSMEQMNQNPYILAWIFFFTLEKLHIFPHWDVHTRKHITAQNSFLSCSVWI